MQLCAIDHDEICFDSGVPCPACQALALLREEESISMSLRDELQDMKVEILSHKESIAILEAINEKI